MKTYKSTIGKYDLTVNKSDFPKAKICAASDADEFIRKFYGDDIQIYESFYLLLLNRSNITTGYVKISKGGTAGTVVDIKIICKYAVEALAHGAIIAHNHPSGELRPSEADIAMTKRVKNALLIFDINLLDHIILTAESYTSLADEGHL